MTNAERRELLTRARQSGYQGSILDVFSAHRQGIDILSQSMPVATTPEQQQAGLIPAHQSGNTGASMVFPDLPPNQPMTTVGLKAPIDITKVDDRGNVVESYKSVPPGIVNLPTGPNRGTVIETPAKTFQTGGVAEKIKLRQQNKLSKYCYSCGGFWQKM